MPLRVVWATSAARQFRKLTEEAQRRIAPRVDALALNAIPPDAKRLQGAGPQIWRIRIGDHRVVYQIQRKEVVLLIVAVGHRRDIYERL